MKLHYCLRRMSDTHPLHLLGRVARPLDTLCIQRRFDRPQRSQQLARVAARWTPADHYVLMGSGTLLFARAATAGGLKPADMTIVEGEDIDEVFETILEQCDHDPLIVGMCNVKGGGTALTRFFSNRANMVAEA